MKEASSSFGAVAILLTSVAVIITFSANFTAAGTDTSPLCDRFATIRVRFPSCRETPPPPPPADICPNVPGTQTSGPCADAQCVQQGGTWNGTSCVMPPPPPPPAPDNNRGRDECERYLGSGRGIPPACVPSVHITYPNGGETFTVGDVVELKWESNRANRCSVGYSTGPDTLDWIATDLPGSQKSLAWTVKSFGSTFQSQQQKIYILCNSVAPTAQFSDYSDDFFTVNPVDVCPNVPGIQGSGPCADQQCTEQGGTWNGNSCVMPLDVCPNVPGNQPPGQPWACEDVDCVSQGGIWTGTSCNWPPPPAECSDGKDNDHDGERDFPADIGCSSSSDTNEFDPNLELGTFTFSPVEADKHIFPGDAVVGVFSITVGVEPISIGRMRFAISAIGMDVRDIKNFRILNNEGVIVAGPVDASSGYYGEPYISFKGEHDPNHNSFILPVGTHIFRVVGTIPPHVQVGATITLATAPGWGWWDAGGEISDRPIVLPQQLYVMNTVTVVGPGWTACSDGVDNDQDGTHDFPNDSDCSSLEDDKENDSTVPMATFQILSIPVSATITPGERVLGSFSTTVTAEPIVASHPIFVLNFGGGVSTVDAFAGIGQIKLVNDAGTIVSGPGQLFVSAQGPAAVFAGPIVFPLGESKYTLVGSIPSNIEAGTTITLRTTPAQWGAKGKFSGSEILLDPFAFFDMETLTVSNSGGAGGGGGGPAPSGSN